MLSFKNMKDNKIQIYITPCVSFVREEKAEILQQSSVKVFLIKYSYHFCLGSHVTVCCRRKLRKQEYQQAA